MIFFPLSATAKESLWEVYELRDRVLRFNVLDGAIQQRSSVPVIPRVPPVEPRAVPSQVEPPMVAVQDTFPTVLPWQNGVFPAWGDRRREEDTISMSNISMVAHPGRWSAMGEESTDGASHSHGSKVSRNVRMDIKIDWVTHGQMGIPVFSSAQFLCNPLSYRVVSGSYIHKCWQID